MSPSSAAARKTLNGNTEKSDIMLPDGFAAYSTTTNYQLALPRSPTSAYCKNKAKNDEEIYNIIGCIRAGVPLFVHSRAVNKYVFATVQSPAMRGDEEAKEFLLDADIYNMKEERFG